MTAEQIIHLILGILLVGPILFLLATLCIKGAINVWQGM